MANQPVAIVARLQAKAGMEEHLKRELMNLLAPTRAENGCLYYNLHQSADDPCSFLFFEKWSSKKAFEAHLKTPHLKALLAASEVALAKPVDITSWNPLDAS